MTIAANTGHGDAALWQAAAAGEHAAFGQLFDRHATAVYNYLYRRTADWSAAEDLTAAVFLHAWRRRGEVVLDRDSALPRLLGVARLQLRNATRSRARYLAALSRVGREAMTAGGLAPCMRRARRSGTARSRCNSRFRPECVRATTNLGSVRLTGLTSRIGGAEVEYVKSPRTEPCTPDGPVPAPPKVEPQAAEPTSIWDLPGPRWLWHEVDVDREVEMG
ncbi:MAG TPA: sigma factor [Streptosporangiaceae bacterium]|nr:sigma factor [Streptosporangiaceae bacterium]